MPRKRRILYHAGFRRLFRREERVFILWASTTLFETVELDREVRFCAMVGSEVSFCCRCASKEEDAPLEVDAIAVEGRRYRRQSIVHYLPILRRIWCWRLCARSRLVYIKSNDKM